MPPSRRTHSIPTVTTMRAYHYSTSNRVLATVAGYALAAVFAAALAWLLIRT